jgi:hypothetical protein
MIVGFTGTRKGMNSAQKKTFTEVLENIWVAEFHHGDCVGADEQADKIIKKLYGKTSVIHPPDSPKNRAYCSGIVLPTKPALERDRDIVDVSGMLIATPLKSKEEIRSGTWHTIRYARKRSKPVVIIYPDGTRVV